MGKRTLETLISTAFFFVTCIQALSQEVKQPIITNLEWIKPFDPFRIAGNLYYVGSYDLASYFIATSSGGILINTGVAGSDTSITANIRRLGFNPADIKILLTTQAHYDHMGATASLKKLTGARFMVDAGDEQVCLDGGRSDYALGGEKSAYMPVKPDALLHDGDTIRLGEMKIVMLHHPGHTKGSCSFLFTVKDDKGSYQVLIANLPTIVTDKKFSDIPSYPAVAADYAHTFQSLRDLSFDIWVSSHASQFQLHQKYQAGNSYNPHAFFDRAGYDAQLDQLRKAYDEKLKQ